MKTIYKYRIEAENPYTLKMPKGAKVLTAAAQGDSVQIWAEVDPRAETEDRTFETFPTGSEMVEDMGIERAYVNTVFMDWLVFHVYERIN